MYCSVCRKSGGRNHLSTAAHRAAAAPKVVRTSQHRSFPPYEAQYAVSESEEQAAAARLGIDWPPEDEAFAFSAPPEFGILPPVQLPQQAPRPVVTTRPAGASAAVLAALPAPASDRKCPRCGETFRTDNGRAWHDEHRPHCADEAARRLGRTIPAPTYVQQ